MAINPEKFRERLLAERQRIQHRRDRLNDHDGGVGQDVGELTDFDPNHPGDAGTEMFEREKDIALDAHLDAILAQISDALTKIDNGTYGLCDRCGQPISEARLNNLPYATLCITCQERVENQ